MTNRSIEKHVIQQGRLAHPRNPDRTVTGSLRIIFDPQSFSRPHDETRRSFAGGDRLHRALQILWSSHACHLAIQPSVRGYTSASTGFCNGPRCSFAIARTSEG